MIDWCLVNIFIFSIPCRIVAVFCFFIEFVIYFKVKFRCYDIFKGGFLSGFHGGLFQVFRWNYFRFSGGIV